MKYRNQEDRDQPGASRDSANHKTPLGLSPSTAIYRLCDVEALL